MRQSLRLACMRHLAGFVDIVVVMIVGVALAIVFVVVCRPVLTSVDWCPSQHLLFGDLVLANEKVVRQ